ncbi:lysozyme inhibitor LprI family protein [Brucella rhizosphaerae]|nr:lysozyme inhibitor LprI family protein [Brucella rhizosphaerae]
MVLNFREISLAVTMTLMIATYLPTNATAAETKIDTKDTLTQCYDEIGDAPRTELSACFDKKEKQAATALELKIEEVRKEITDTDSSGSKDALASLTKSQETFEIFKKAECSRVRDAAMGGSGADDEARACAIDLTIWRTQRLSN